jgi:hypothetical protein
MGTGVIQNNALPFSSVIGTGHYASLRASDTGPIFLLEEEPRSFELHPWALMLVSAKPLAFS